jgi:GTP-binding protein
MYSTCTTRWICRNNNILVDIKSTEFIASYPRIGLCPNDGRPEFAFIGRSNVGKSSLINMLTKKGLAKVSGTPGKTQLINYFLMNGQWYLVDLPGYGYAKLSKSRQRSLSTMIDNYLMQRLPLTLAFVLIDVNVPPMKMDIQFINNLGEHGIPFVLLFTKSDRMGPVAAQNSADVFLAELAKDWETLPKYFITSSERKTGKEEVLEYIGEIIKSLKG